MIELINIALVSGAINVWSAENPVFKFVITVTKAFIKKLLWLSIWRQGIKFYWNNNFFSTCPLQWCLLFLVLVYKWQFMLYKILYKKLRFVKRKFSIQKSDLYIRLWFSCTLNKEKCILVTRYCVIKKLIVCM